MNKQNFIQLHNKGEFYKKIALSLALNAVILAFLYIVKVYAPYDENGALYVGVAWLILLGTLSLAMFLAGSQICHIFNVKDVINTALKRKNRLQ